MLLAHEQPKFGIHVEGNVLTTKNGLARINANIVLSVHAWIYF